jgi:hypothetical protein
VTFRAKTRTSQVNHTDAYRSTPARPEYAAYYP